MKMNDLGHRYDEDMGISTPKNSKEKNVYYPSETFTEEQMPGLSGRKAGDTVKITIEAKVRSVEIRDVENKKKKTEYRLEFRKGYCDEGTTSGSKADKISALISAKPEKGDDGE